MLNHIHRILLATVLIALFSGCAETSRPQATGKGSVRGISAIVEAPDVFFRIEERTIEDVEYKGVAGFVQYDDLSYNFNFDINLAGENDPTRLVSQFIDVVKDVEYTMVLTGTIASPGIILWEDDSREFAASDTVFEPYFANFSPATGSVDVYFAAPGTPPAANDFVGTLANGERLSPRDFTEGDYVLTLTAPNDPTAIIYTSEVILAVAGSRPLFAVFDPDPSITAPVAVSLINQSGSAQNIPDPAHPAELRFYQSSFTTGNVDVYFDDDFSSPVFSNIAFDELTVYVPLPENSAKVSVTDAGNTGAILIEADVIIAAGGRRTVTLAGESSLLGLNNTTDDGRPLATSPVVRVSNFAVNGPFVNIYLLDPGTEITDESLPIFTGLPAYVDTGYFGPVDGSYEMTVTLFGEREPIADALPLDLNVGEVVDITILDTADPTMLELSLIDVR